MARAQDLPGGLVLRAARPDDLKQIGDLLVERGDEADRLDHRLVVEDSEAGYESCAVVVDGQRVVSTAVLLDERLIVADGGIEVELPAGQIELVATDTDYEGRGCVRALMSWAHERSAERDQLLQVMIGIPYFYRLFGYQYAIDCPRRAAVTDVRPAMASYVVRDAVAADVPTLRSLQRAAQRDSGVRMPHSAACWRWLLARDGGRVVLVERGGRPVATGRLSPAEEPDLLGEVAATDEDAAAALLAYAVDIASATENVDGLDVSDRPGTPISAVLPAPSDEPGPAEMFYVRVEEPAGLFDALRPVMQARLEVAGIVIEDDLVLSFFGSHVRLPVTNGHIGPPLLGGTMQAPGVHGGAGIAPDQVGALLFGPLGIKGLSRMRPDVYYPSNRADVMETLFPAMSSDLLTYYLA